jgi:hypothetical protein
MEGARVRDSAGFRQCGAENPAVSRSTACRLDNELTIESDRCFVLADTDPLVDGWLVTRTPNE